MNNALIPSIIILPWKSNAAEFWFNGLSDQNWAMLLHSGYANHPYNRFDIIVADPICYVETYGNISFINKKESVIQSDKDPLVLVNSILKSLKLSAKYDFNLPFQGGAVGLLGYDLVRNFENLLTKSIKDIYLPDMAIGFYDWTMIIDHYKKKISLLSYNDPYKRLAWLKQQSAKIMTPFSLTSEWKSNMTYEEYTEKFFKIQEYLRSGDCYQINLAQRFEASYIGGEWQAFCCLNKYNRAPFSAFLRFKNGVVLSLSPERFIQLSNGNIQTRPIKGTLPRAVNSKDDYQQIIKLSLSEKNQAENLMIVDLMRNDIGKVAKPGSVSVPELFVVEKFSTVYHLVSTIVAKLEESKNACDLLRASFPGGSITGAPKIRAMEIINELEPNYRNVWCGCIGYLSLCGNMDTNIAIRTIIAYNNKLYCSAGGGIIIDSKVNEEYQETIDKVKFIFQLLKTR